MDGSTRRRGGTGPTTWCSPIFWRAHFSKWRASLRYTFYLAERRSSRAFSRVRCARFSRRICAVASGWRQSRGTGPGRRYLCVDLPAQSVADVSLADPAACGEGRVVENAGDIGRRKPDTGEFAIGHHRHLLHDWAPVPPLGELGEKSARPSEALAGGSRDVDG